MNNDTLNKMSIGDKIVEMKELNYYHNSVKYNVIDVRIYLCKSINIFGKRKIETISFPFYFSTKELAEEFTQSYQNFKITISDSPYACVCLIANCNNSDYKKIYCMLSNIKMHGIIYEDYYTPLQKGGIWGGLVETEYDEHYRINVKGIDYKKTLCYTEETGNTHIYKLEKL